MSVSEAKKEEMWQMLQAATLKAIETPFVSLADVSTLFHTDQQALSGVRDELRFVLLSDFKNIIGTERAGNHYWHVWFGPTCKCCHGAPKSVGEMFLAKYSHDWLCNSCYARNPQPGPTQHGWRYIQVDEDEELEQ